MAQGDAAQGKSALDQLLASYIASLQGGAALAGADVARLVDSLTTAAGSQLAAGDSALVTQIRDLGDYIRKAKQEIAALRPQEIRQQYVAAASDELDAVVSATETATNDILSAAEKIEAECAGMAPQVGAKVSEQVTTIFTACGFQDITGQRITKVVKALKEIDRRVEGILAAIGETPQAPRAAEPRVTGERAMLHGPQNPKDAMNQTDVDRIMAGKS